MDVTEQPIVFDCEGDELVGMLHLPALVHARGLIVVVAGGPQYRGGVGRLQVQMARELCAHGVPVLRFDYRGMGDSSGTFRGFEHVGPDLAAAVATFRRHAPDVREFVLWGGCDAASAIMLNAWRLPSVTGIITGNPFARTDETEVAATINRHYRQRMRDPAFWRKVVRLQYNPIPALLTLGKGLRHAWRLRAPGPMESGPDSTRHFVDRMCDGLSRFRGDMLLLMSGRSLVSQEFDELVTGSADWRRAMRSPRHVTRHDMPDADQTYSSMASRADVISATCRWMLDANALSGDPPRSSDRALEAGAA